MSGRQQHADTHAGGADDPTVVIATGAWQGNGRPIGKTLIAIGLLIAGWLGFRQLGVEALPSTDTPRIYVQASLPGAGARVVSRSVAAPLERYLGQIAGVEGIYSSSGAGTVMLQLSFTHGTDIDRAAREVQQAITAATPSLPRSMPEPPVYFRYDNTIAPLVMLTLTSPALSREGLYTLADEHLVPFLARIPGVARVQVFGGSRAALRVRLDTQALANMRLTPSDVANVLRAQGVPFPLGTVRQGATLWSIDVEAQTQTPGRMAALVVAQRDGREVTLGDVARIEPGPADPANVAYFQGRPAVLVQMTRRSGANAVETTDAVRAALADFTHSQKDPVALSAMFDLTAATRSAVREVGWTLLVSVGLVVLVTLAFVRRLAQTVLIAVTIPLSLAGTMVAMYALGFTLNMLTLLSLVLCVGFVVDDAIVMVESITRYVERGTPPARAAALAFRDLRATLLCMTLSLLAALVPVLAGNGQIYIFLRQFSVTLAVAAVMSLIVSLFILPPLCAAHLATSSASAGHPGGAGGGRLALAVDAMLRGRRFLRWLPLLMVLLSVGMYQAVLASAGTAYMPAEDTGLVQARLATAPGASVDVRTRVLRDAQAVVREDPDVHRVAGSIDDGGAQLYIDLRPRGAARDERHDGIAAVVNRLASRLGEVTGAAPVVGSVGFLGNGAFSASSGVGAANTFELMSYDGTDLDPWISRLSERLSRDPSFARVQNDGGTRTGEFRIHVDRDTASRLGVSMATIDDTLFDAFGDQSMSVGAGPSGQDRPVILSASMPVPTPAALLDVHVRSSSASMIPLGAIGRVDALPGDAGIVHQDQIEAAALHYDLASGTTPDRAMERITQAGFDVGLPEGVRIRFDGEGRMIEALRSNSVELVAAALVAVFVVLGVLYESLVHPLTILSCLPAAVAGAFMAMWITHTPMTTVSLIAIILLVGVVKRNAIILVNFALVAMRERGLGPVEAIREACLTRFRPIAMTSLVAIGTAVPLIVGSGTGDGVQRPLGIAIAGGLLLAQVLAFVTTPAAFLLAHDLGPALRAMFRRLGRVGRSPRRPA